MPRLFHLIPYVLLLSCAPPSVPAHFTDTTPPLKYPASAYITAAAESDVSPADAEQRARIAIVRQISLRVQEVFEKVESERHTAGRSSASGSTTSRLREESGFSRAHLIDIADRGTYGRKHYALAVLARQKAGAALADEYRAAVGGFREAVALTKQKESDPAAFTATYRNARASYAQARPLGLELAAVDPSREDEVREDLRLLGELWASRARVLSAAAVRIVEQGSEDAAARVSAVIARELSALGVRVGTGASTATLELKVEESWPRGLGLCCQWSPRVVLNGQPVKLDLNVVGCTNGRDRSLARDDAAAQLTAESLRPALQTALSNFVPLEEGS